MTLSANELNKLLPNIVQKSFKGIFMSDEIPKREVGYYIFNLDNSAGDYSKEDDTSIGNHWVGLSIKSDKAEYFDPFGEPPHENIIKWLKKRRPKYEIWYNTSQIQNLESDRCGWYVLYFLTSTAKVTSFYDIIHSYDKNTKKNEDKIGRKYHL